MPHFCLLGADELKPELALNCEAEWQHEGRQLIAGEYLCGSILGIWFNWSVIGRYISYCAKGTISIVHQILQCSFTLRGLEMASDIVPAKNHKEGPEECGPFFVSIH